MTRRTKAACFHEAARAVARLVIGRKPERVSMRRNGTGPAERPDRLVAVRGQYDIWDEILLLFAGPFAEARVRKCKVAVLLPATRHEDCFDAETWLRWLVAHGFADDAHTALLRAEAEVRLFLRTHWRTIESVAEVLLDRGVVEADELTRIFRTIATTTDRW